MNLENIIASPAHKTVYRDGDQAIKVFDETYNKADILNEALNTARVEETGLNIPKLISVSMVDGKWAIATEYIPGKTLAQLMAENPEKEDEYLNMFVDIQLDIHKHTCPMLNMLTEKMQRKISATTLDATTRYELHTRLAAMHVHKKVCHGDFNPSNIIVTPEGKTYILDWAHATQGNASADVARTYLLFVLEGKEQLAEKYMNLFCKKSDTAKQYVQKWIPIVAASQSVKGKEEEMELLHRWASVCEYE
ncbi:MAG: phosphotransferase [Clostridia bacterium]|nr:phosphotransferase [Clostridia bacterium]